MCFFFLFGDFFCFLFCILFFFFGGWGWANLTLKSRLTGFNFKTQNQPKKSTSKNRKSRLQNHLQNAIEQAPYKKHNFITEFIQAPNITTKFHRSPKKSPTKWLPQGSESSKRNCYKMTIFCWNSTRSCNWIFTANWLAHGHRFLQKHLYKQHCSEHKGPLSVGDISTHIFSEPICRWTAYDCLIALERRHLTHFIWQRVFRKTRVFTANPGFAGQTSVFVVNTGNFKGLEAQGIYIIYTYVCICMYMNNIRIYIYTGHLHTCCLYYTDYLQVSKTDLGPGGADHGVTRPVIHLLGPLRHSNTPFCMAHTADAWNMLKSAAWKRAYLLNNFVGIPYVCSISPHGCVVVSDYFQGSKTVEPRPGKDSSRITTWTWDYTSGSSSLKFHDGHSGCGYYNKKATV